jgi:hypothetical protein
MKRDGRKLAHNTLEELRVLAVTQHIIDWLQPYDFDRLARKEPDGRCRLRLIALAHPKEGKNCS